jgi:hypothetical protein
MLINLRMWINRIEAGGETHPQFNQAPHRSFILASFEQGAASTDTDECHKGHNQTKENARSSLLHPAATPLGSLTLAEAPLVDAENLFRQPGPPLAHK